MFKIETYIKSVWSVAKQKNKTVTFQLNQLKKILFYLHGHKNKIFIGIFLLFMISLISMPIPYFTKVLIDDVFPQKNIVSLNLIILVILLLYFGKVVLSFLMNYIFTILNQSIQVSIRKDFFNKLIRLPLSYYSKQQTGYLLARLQEIQGINTFFSNSLLSLVVNLLEFIFIIFILFYLDWMLTCIAILILPIYFFTVKFLSNGLRASSLDLREKTAQLSKNIQESLSGINVIKTFNAEELETLKIHKKLTDYFHSGVIQSIFLSLSSETVFFIGALGTTTLLWFSGLRIINGSFTVGLYVAFTGYLSRLYSHTYKFASIGIILQPAIVALTRILEISSILCEDDDERLINISKLRGEIIFDRVSFDYGDGKNVLHNISFHIYPGQKIAIIGPNGSGKTTLVSLILQFYKPKLGKIYLDGIDASMIRLRCLRERVGIVSQEVFLFDDSIKNNIKYGKPEASNEEVLLASKMSYAHDFIEKLPDKYDTLVGERGIRLSVGQKQRISIARAILYNPDILIFDEATSALDVLAERAIREFIFSNNTKTIIIVTHRLPTVFYVDWIIVLDKGKIKQQGRPNELLNNEGLFKTLFESNKIKESL